MYIIMFTIYHHACWLYIYCLNLSSIVKVYSTISTFCLRPVLPMTVEPALLLVCLQLEPPIWRPGMDGWPRKSGCVAVQGDLQKRPSSKIKPDQYWEWLQDNDFKHLQTENGPVMSSSCTPGLWDHTTFGGLSTMGTMGTMRHLQRNELKFRLRSNGHPRIPSPSQIVKDLLCTSECEQKHQKIHV